MTFKCPKCLKETSLKPGEAQVCHECGHNFLVASVPRIPIKPLTKGSTIKIDGFTYKVTKLLEGHRYMLKRING